MSIDKNYIKRIFYTFCPKFIFKLLPFRFLQRWYWQKQNANSPHGYEKYDFSQGIRDKVLTDEIKLRAEKTDALLDLGCNCGRDLYQLKQDGYKKLSGVDICANAIEYGRNKFDLKGVELVIGSYEDVLPRFLSQGRKFDLIYSGGASVSLVHPSFDIIKYICALAGRYVILLNEDNQDSAYSRFWECEFRRHGFEMVKYLRPAYADEASSGILSSIAVYSRIDKK